MGNSSYASSPPIAAPAIENGNALYYYGPAEQLESMLLRLTQCHHSLETLLVDELDLDRYYVPGHSEVIGVEFQEFCIFCAYTQESKVAPVMFDNLSKIREAPEFKDKKAIFVMDANAHHESWLGSKLTDDAGE